MVKKIVIMAMLFCLTAGVCNAEIKPLTIGDKQYQISAYTDNSGLAGLNGQTVTFYKDQDAKKYQMGFATMTKWSRNQGILAFAPNAEMVIDKKTYLLTPLLRSKLGDEEFGDIEAIYQVPNEVVTQIKSAKKISLRCKWGDGRSYTSEVYIENLPSKSIAEWVKIIDDRYTNAEEESQAPVAVKATEAIIAVPSPSQTALAQSQLALQINLSIDNAKNLTPEQKQAAKDLYGAVKAEVTKENPNWQKVNDLLKNSLDYGLTIAPDIIRFAEMYYKAKL